MIPYSVQELKIVARTHTMDIYHSELMRWAAEQLDAKDKLLTNDELIALSKYLLKEYLPYTDSNLHNAVRKIMKAADELDRESSPPTSGS